MQLDPASNQFEIFQSEKKFGEIRLDNTHYEGPDYSIALFESKKHDVKRQILVIEAMADIGTALYCVSVLTDSGIANSFIVNEPRGDSEQYSLKDVLSISSTDNELELRFKKKHLGRYSETPEGLKEDTEYIYLTKQITSNE